jgi:peroxiredoxin
MTLALALIPLGPAIANDPFTSMALIRPPRPHTAEEFSVKSPDGKTIRLADYRGKVVFLNFWATWCAPCRDEMPAMQRLYQKYRDRGLVVLAVSLDSETSGVAPFVKQLGVSFPIAQDLTWTVAERYRVNRLPSSFLVDRQGTLVALAIGPRDWDTTPAHAVMESLLR